MSAAALLLSAFIAVGARAEGDEPIVVRLYHTNDIHGWIMPRPDKFQNGRLVGGAAALASLIAKDSGPKLIVDAGDWWQGTPEGSLSKGEALADVFNAIGYDAVVVGNHEYDAGADSLKALIGKMNMPVLSANTYDQGEPASWVRPWIIKEVAGVKFGIFGLTTSNMPRLTFSKHIVGLSFRREVDEARDMVKALKRAGATVIIAVTHVGLEKEGASLEGDQTIARETPGIDVIVGGHSHTFLSRPLRAGDGTLIAQAGAQLVKVGRVTLEIDPKTMKVSKSSGELLDLWNDRVGENPELKAIALKHERMAGREFEVVLATAAGALIRDADGESSIGDWMTDCYRERADVQVALQNGGGIRGDIAAGPVTVRSLFQVMPFDNTLVKLSMLGSDLRRVFQQGAGGARMIQVSGAELGVRRSRPPWERLDSVSVGGAPLDDARIYTVAALDFMTAGGDGYSAFDHFISSETTGVPARDALLDCARRQGTIAAPAAGRVIFRED
ncbi:MAG: bifunctional UDP-sugar hydrolase/5'-nucleotidase [Elusimicrobiota bacterium]